MVRDDRKFGYKCLLSQRNTKSKHTKLGVLGFLLFLLYILTNPVVNGLKTVYIEDTFILNNIDDAARRQFCLPSDCILNYIIQNRIYKPRGNLCLVIHIHRQVVVVCCCCCCFYIETSYVK